MSELKPGDAAPDFSVPADDDGTVSLSGFKGQKLILYFYFKDNTPGCTLESCAFRDNLSRFNALKINVLGISKDSVAKHRKFKEKYKLNFPLLSDEEGILCEDYGVWVEKSICGYKYMGIERSTFLIDEQGIIRHIWRKAKVFGHIKDVLETANTLSEAG